MLKIKRKIREGELLHEYHRHRLMGKVSVGSAVRKLDSFEMQQLRKANDLRRGAPLNASNEPSATGPSSLALH